MKIKSLLVVFCALLLSGCVTTMIVGTMVESGVRRVVVSPEKHWYFVGENTGNGCTPFVVLWSAEPLIQVSSENTARASCYIYDTYKDESLPNRYLNIFTVEKISGDKQLKVASFDMQFLMHNKPIIYGKLVVSYNKENNIASVIYNQANLNNKEVSLNTGNVYFKSKPPVILDTKELSGVN